MDGDPVEGFIPATVNCTYDGVDFTMPNQIMQYVLNIVYRVQTAD